MSKTTKNRQKARKAGDHAIPVTLVLADTTARKLMTRNPLSVRADASVKEATALMVDCGYSALPVVNEAGRAAGVVSRADLVQYARENVRYRDQPEDKRRPGFQVEDVDEADVSDIMTPMVFSIAPEAAAITVVEEMLARKVHRLYVVDDVGALIGVISAIDILRNLHRGAE